MNWVRFFLCITLGVFFFSSCENEQEPVLVKECDPAVPVTYSNSISQILSTNCLGCHFSGGNVPNLHNYAQVQAHAPRIIKAVNHQPGVLPMPQGSAKLDAATLKKFKCWEQQGFKE